MTQRDAEPEAHEERPAFGAPPPDPELRRLEPLVGTWRADDTTRASVLGPAVPVTSVETFAWLDGGYFLVHTYETVFGAEPAQKGVSYWRYDAGGQRFRIIFFSNNGSYTEAGSQYAGEAAGGTLTMEGPARFQYDLDEDGRIRTNPDGTLSVAWWLRDEHGAWQPWMTNTFTRVSGRP